MGRWLCCFNRNNLCRSRRCLSSGRFGLVTLAFLMKYKVHADGALAAAFLFAVRARFAGEEIVHRPRAVPESSLASAATHEALIHVDHLREDQKRLWVFPQTQHRASSGRPLFVVLVVDLELVVVQEILVVAVLVVEAESSRRDKIHG